MNELRTFSNPRLWLLRRLMLKYTLMAHTSTLGTGGMMGALGLMSVRYMALESSSSDGGTFSFRCRSSHCQWDIFRTMHITTFFPPIYFVQKETIAWMPSLKTKSHQDNLIVIRTVFTCCICRRSWSVVRPRDLIPRVRHAACSSETVIAATPSAAIICSRDSEGNFKKGP